MQQWTQIQTLLRIQIPNDALTIAGDPGSLTDFPVPLLPGPQYIIFDDGLRAKLASMPYPEWGRHIDSIIRLEQRRFADQAWRLHLEGRIDRRELAVAMTASQLRELEQRATP